MTEPVVLALDAGTTSVRAFAVNLEGLPVGQCSRPIPQHFPRPGWVEHDALEIWDATLGALSELAKQLHDQNKEVVALGITNQRETALLWDRRTGMPCYRAIVWQDRRTAEHCAAMREQNIEHHIRDRTGLVLDPYFSATKIAWLLSEPNVEVSPDTIFGTVDTWLLWKLTGGPDGGKHSTDPSNASRTMLFDLDTLTWSPDLLDLFEIPSSLLAEIAPTVGIFGKTRPENAAGLSVPIAAIAGDQQAALFGQACIAVGMTKATFGTGAFVLANAGPLRPPVVDGLLTSVAWSIGEKTTYVIEGAILAAGATVEWLRDGLGIIAEPSELESLARRVPDTGDVYFVPAFAGLGSPTWDSEARGTIIGLTRGTGKAELARATIEAMAFGTRDVVSAMRIARGVGITELRIDGGVSVMDLLGELLADQLGVPVRRSAIGETTALGAAYLAGIGAGVWDSPEQVAALWRSDSTFTQRSEQGHADSRYARWQAALTRSRGWANT